MDPSLSQTLLLALKNLPALKLIILDGNPFLPEIDQYLKKRGIQVEWEIEEIDSGEERD